MAKKSKEGRNATTSFNWAFGVIANQDLSPSQQLTFLHIVDRLNKNFWQPVKISVPRLAAAMNMDKRTAEKAVAFLSENGVVIFENGLFDIPFLLETAEDDEPPSPPSDKTLPADDDSPAYMKWS